jgi:hypothetical protein
VPNAFSPPEFVFLPEYLVMVSSTNTNTFGYWQSPEEVIPADADYLYRARFTVRSNLEAKELTPQIRLRANSLNLQQGTVLGIESAGDGGASPDMSGTDYDLYFVPLADDDYVVLAFDLLNFNPDDAPEAELWLDTVIVERFDLDSLPLPTVVKEYTFDVSADGWTSKGAPIFYSLPEYAQSASTLQLRATNNTNTFGYWYSDPADITIGANQLYRGIFDVRTDVSDRALVPEMRLRFNTLNLQASSMLDVKSSGDGANSPGLTNTTYDKLYFMPPENCVGQGMMVSFDLLNFSPEDAPTGSLILDRVRIESLSPPAAP